MKNFVELIKRVHQERFSVVISRIVAEKIPVAFLSIAPLENSIANIKNLRAQGLNVTNLISTAPPPVFQNDFTITPLDKISKIHPRPEFIFVENAIDARVAKKFLPETKILFPAAGNPDFAYEIFMNHLDDLQEVYESLIDETSRRTFCGYWHGRISNQLDKIIHANTPQYFTEGFIPEPGAIVIDGGVFDGSTSALFADLGCKVYGFELDRNNFEVAKILAKKKNFTVENLGLGSYNHEIKYTSNGSGSRFDLNGKDTAQIVTLDDYVRDKKIPRVDFIKMDVEGAELEVLKGAALTILRFKPILALSAYHKWEDFWELMNFIKSIRADYEFAMRQYVTEPNAGDVKEIFQNGAADIFKNLGLDVNWKFYYECCLLAR